MTKNLAFDADSAILEFSSEKCSLPMIKKVNPTNYAGAITCYMQEDMSRSGGKITFVTLHDTQSSYHAFLPFVNSSHMSRVRERARFVHLVMPGHDDSAVLWQGDMYPTCDELAHDVNDVIDAFGFGACICLGSGAGANILCRFVLRYPNRCLGLIAIDMLAAPASIYSQLIQGVTGVTVTQAKWMEKGKQLANKSAGLVGGDSSQSSYRIPADNLQMYEKAYMQRTDLRQLLADGLSSEVLLISGEYSANVKECRRVLRSMDKRRTTFVQFDKTNDILVERHFQLARALVLFSKSCGVLLGVPMFGLEAEYDKVAMRANKQAVAEECQPQVVREIAKQLISHERRLEAYLDGEHNM
jgi:protein NDRG1